MRRSALLALLIPTVTFAQGEGDAPAVAAADAADAASAPAAPVVDAAELEAFKATVGRFSDRMKEFQGDARAEVDRAEAEDRRALTRSYEAVLAEYSADDLALRATAMRRFEDFLNKYPRAPHSAHVMFRLAELYVEETEEANLAAELAFQRAMSALEEGGDLTDLPEEPKRDFSRSIALYRRILAEFPEYPNIDGPYYMLGYLLSEDGTVQQDEAEGLEMFRALVRERPESPYLADAHLRIGEYYFDYNKLTEAIPHYEKVVEIEGENGRLYDEGLYKLAWTHYRRSDYSAALARLGQLLDWSTGVYKSRTGRESTMTPEAIDYTAISISDMAALGGQRPLDVAAAFFARLGPREYERRVYKKLGEVLTQQAAWDDAIATYAYLQQRWPLDPENPTLQHQIATLYATKVPPDNESANRAIAELTDRYSDQGAWFAANRANPDALAVARQFIEQSLASVAVNLHQVADESRLPSDYARAADLYGQYLRKFPFASDYYEIQYYYASTAYRAGRLDVAAEEFERLSRAKGHNYKEASAWFLRGLDQESRKAAGLLYGDLPPDSPKESEVELANGKTRPVHTLGPTSQRTVELTEALLAINSEAVLERLRKAVQDAPDARLKERAQADLENVQGAVKAIGEARPQLEYQLGQVYVAHGRFDEARERLRSVIAAHPETEVAAMAAFLDIDTYLQEDDLIAYRRKVAEYSRMTLGAQEETAGKFQSQLEQVDFTLAENLGAAKDHVGAAEAYLKFYDTYPNAERRPTALRNAANNYERAGRMDDAIRLLERFVATYPDDPLSRAFSFRLGENYAQTLDLAKAIRYFDDLYQRTRGSGISDPNAAAALYNAALFRIGLGDYAGSARTFELYGKAFPEEPDAEVAAFRAGEQYERVSDREALAFYARYLRTWGDRNPDHVMQALFKIAELTEKTGKAREVDAAWAEVLAGYRRLSAAGPVGRAGKHYAARAEFRELEQALAAFRQIRFTNDDERNAKLLGDVKAEELRSISAKADAIVSTYGDFEYSSGAYMLKGQASFAYADMAFDMPVPPAIAADEESLVVYQELVAEKYRIPFEDKGKEFLLAVLKVASDQRRWSRFQSETTDLLATRFPAEFAPEKVLIQGVGDAAVIPQAGPVGVRKPPPKEEGK
jgi:TolA-binding protein